MKTKQVSEQGMERRLRYLIERTLCRQDGHVRTFEEAGVLTTDRGLAVTLPNEQRFYITIQEDRR